MKIKSVENAKNQMTIILTWKHLMVPFWHIWPLHGKDENLIDFFAKQTKDCS